MRHTAWLGCVVAAVSIAQDFRSNVEIVVVPATVVDAHGAAVAGLTRDQFQVFDNDVRRPIQSFWVDNSQPITLGVLIDTSESQKDLIEEHRQTALALLERILRPGDRAFVVSVNENVRLWADFTANIAELRKALAGSPNEALGERCPASACGSSPLWNAIYDAATLKLRPLTGNKALLILTDGFDSGSGRTWQRAADAATQADTSVYALQYQSGFGGRFAPDLYRLVTAAGGTWFHARPGDYQDVATRIETDLRHRYVLGFRPEQLSGKVRHNIRVEVDRPELVVRARTTYFREPGGEGK